MEEGINFFKPENISSIPEGYGVYLFFDANREIIYIGKAVNLQRRVRSHFSSRSNKGNIFKEKVKTIGIKECANEEQALLLEASLIKENRPRYNIELKDDKSYPYLLITNHHYPRVLIKRNPFSQEGEKIGPFTNIKILRKALGLIRKIFPYCSCLKPSKNCLYVHLKLCPNIDDPQIGLEEYKENIANIRRIFFGERKALLNDLHRRMQEYSEKKLFEQAARIRDQIIAVTAIYAGRRQANELLLLKQVLNLKKMPIHIEGFDISNLAGKDSTAAVVVFIHGQPQKSQYRHFRIKYSPKNSDVDMIKEVVLRRYRRLQQENKPLPDLVVIDGGLGQLNAAQKAVNSLGLDLFICSLAKRNEEIWLPSLKKPIVLSRDNPALHLLQRVRDEAHRFCRRYHHKLREKQIFPKK